MPQFYPDGVNAINMGRAQTAEPITVPAEGSFDTPALQGSMQQILSENLGRYVTVDFTMGTNTFQRRAGILYAVGRSFVVLYNEAFQSFNVIDIFSVKTVSFFGTERPQWITDQALMSLSGVMGGDGNLSQEEIALGRSAVAPMSRNTMDSMPQSKPQNTSGNYRSMCNR